MEASDDDDCASETDLMVDVLFCDTAIYTKVIFVFHGVRASTSSGGRGGIFGDITAQHHFKYGTLTVA